MTNLFHATPARAPGGAGVSRAAARGAFGEDRATIVRLALLTLCALALLIGAAQQAGAKAAPDSFADLADRLSPAVVNISTSHTVTPSERPRGPMLPEDSPFRQLFPDLFGDQGGGHPQQVNSLGSGFVISADGYIVTNNHVIDGADEIKANFADGRSLDAKLIGTDPKTDVSLLKVESDEPLPFVNFGDSDAARVGDWVLAIGNPFGLGGSVSAGIISARNRDINAGPYDDFLQTDAAINRGNSGGPLFNMDGDVVGINTAIISPSGGSIGIGFAVPANIANHVVEQLREHGVTRRGWLGVQIQGVTPEIAEGLGLEHPEGALVAGVVEDGPAAKGGLEVGDVIMKFDNRDVKEMRDLPRMVADTDVGKSVRVLVWRKDKTMTLKIEVGLLDEGPNVVNASVEKPAQEQGAEQVLGMTLSPLSAAKRQAAGLPDDIKGVLVEQVDQDGPAASKGLSAGDVIVEAGQEEVQTPADIADKVKAARDAGRKSVLLLVHSGGDLRFVAVSLENSK